MNYDIHRTIAICLFNVRTNVERNSLYYYLWLHFISRKNQKSNNLVKSTAVKAATGKPNQMRTNFML